MSKNDNPEFIISENKDESSDEDKWVDPTPSYNTPGMPSQYQRSYPFPCNIIFKSKSQTTSGMYLSEYLEHVDFGGNSISSLSKSRSKHSYTLPEALGAVSWTIENGPIIGLTDLVDFFSANRDQHSLTAKDFCKDLFFSVAQELLLLPVSQVSYLKTDLNLLLNSFNYMGLTRQMITDLGYSTHISKSGKFLEFDDDSDSDSDEEEKRESKRKQKKSFLSFFF